MTMCYGFCQVFSESEHVFFGHPLQTYALVNHRDLKLWIITKPYKQKCLFKIRLKYEKMDNFLSEALPFHFSINQLIG